MTVFPVKTHKENSPISPLFGKAKYFAFYDGANLSIKENTKKGGAEIIKWFKDENVKNIIIKEMGVNPYEKIKTTNMKIFYAGDNRVLTNDVLKRLESNSIKELTEEEMQEIIKKHQSRHKHTHH